MYLPPGVLVPAAEELCGGAAERHDLQVLPAELGGHGELLPAAPARRALAVLREHRRVVGHLTPTDTHFKHSDFVKAKVRARE